MSKATDLVLSNEVLFKHAESSDIVEWSKESQFAIQALGKSASIANIAVANPIALQNAIINIAAIGISLNPALKHAYLVPRGGAICLDISYMGLLHIAMDSGSILWGQAKIVYANDEYKNNGLDKPPTHTQKTFSSDKGAVVGAYCTVKTASGDYLTEEMDVAALHKVEASSKSSSGPWKTWREEMQRKTVVKRASKYWPKVGRLGHAIDALNSHEGFEELLTGESEKEVFMVVNKEEVESLTRAIEDAGLTVADVCKRVNVNSLSELAVARYEGAMNWIAGQKEKAAA